MGWVEDCAVSFDHNGECLREAKLQSQMLTLVLIWVRVDAAVCLLDGWIGLEFDDLVQE